MVKVCFDILYQIMYDFLLLITVKGQEINNKCTVVLII